MISLVSGKSLGATHLSSCNVSNFFGFLGQHSQIWAWGWILGAFCLRGAGFPVDIFRAIAALDLVSDGCGCDGRESGCGGAGFIESEVTYGESRPLCCCCWSEEGEIPPGESRSWEEILVMLLPTDKPLDDAYEPFRKLVDDVDETEPWVGGNRFCGEERFAERCAVEGVVLR